MLLLSSDVLAVTPMSPTTALVGLRNGHVYLQDTRCMPGVLLPYHKGGASVNYLANVPGGDPSLYISHCLDHQGLRLYDVRASKLSNGPVLSYGAHSNHSQIQPRVAVSPDGFQLAAVDDRNTLRLWDLVTGCVLACKPVDRSSPLAFRRKGLELLYVDSVGTTLRMLAQPRKQRPSVA
jgi:WD40 repeat protein